MNECHYLNIPQAVIVVENIAWDLSKTEVIGFVSQVCKVEEDWIHILIDTHTGKTKADMYIELSTTFDAIECQKNLSHRILKGRLVRIRMSSQEELEHSLIPNPHVNLSIIAAEVGRIMELCANYKSFFSRKCPERPVEYACSLLRLVPWYKVSHDSIEHLKLLHDYVSSRKEISIAWVSLIK